MHVKDDKEKSALAAFLIIRRAQLNMNQMELSQASGLSSGTIASIEAGHSQAPRPETLTKLAMGLKVSYQELDCIVRDIPYKPGQEKAQEGTAQRALEHYLLNHPRMPKDVAQTLIEMLRTAVSKYEEAPSC
jgi:transcriptional regulator with XRE-family HTH domain